MKHRLIPLLVLLAFLAVACGGGGKKTPLGSADPDSGAIVSRVYEAKIEFEMSGAIAAKWSGENPISIVTNTNAATPKELWILTVGVLPEHVLKTEDGVELRPAFDLVGYQGKDTYKLAAEQAGGLTEEELAEIRENPDLLREKQQSGTLKSTSFVIVVRNGVTSEFATRLDTCTIRVDDEQALKGSITCPRVAGPTGEQVAFEWSWDADPNKPVPTSTSPVPRGSSTTAPRGASNAPTSTAPPPNNGQGSNGNGEVAGPPLDVSVDPDDCATPGTLVTVAVKTIPDAAITLVMAYSDAGTHGNTILGQTGPSGEFNWAFVVPPTVPDGPAKMIVNVTANDNSTTGGRIIDAFEVRRSC